MERALIENYQFYHSAGLYGTGGRHYPYVLAHIIALKPRSIVDYGAGWSDIAVRLARKVRGERVARFDPAIPEFAKLPEGHFDLVINFDVLEHIPEEEIDAVLSEMSSLAEHALIVIDMSPAKKMLADGRNAHVSLHDENWWLHRLSRFFPKIRPFHIGTKGRAAFKTWDEVLPAWRRKLIEPRELVVYAIKRRISNFKRRRQKLRNQRQKSSDANTQ